MLPRDMRLLHFLCPKKITKITKKNYPEKQISQLSQRLSRIYQYLAMNWRQTEHRIWRHYCLQSSLWRSPSDEDTDRENNPSARSTKMPTRTNPKTLTKAQKKKDHDRRKRNPKFDSSQLHCPSPKYKQREKNPNLDNRSTRVPRERKVRGKA